MRVRRGPHTRRRSSPSPTGARRRRRRERADPRHDHSRSASSARVERTLRGGRRARSRAQRHVVPDRAAEVGQRRLGLVAAIRARRHLPVQRRAIQTRSIAAERAPRGRAAPRGSCAVVDGVPGTDTVAARRARQVAGYGLPQRRAAAVAGRATSGRRRVEAVRGRLTGAHRGVGRWHGGRRCASVLALGCTEKRSAARGRRPFRAPSAVLLPASRASRGAVAAARPRPRSPARARTSSPRRRRSSEIVPLTRSGSFARAPRSTAEFASISRATATASPGACATDASPGRRSTSRTRQAVAAARRRPAHVARRQPAARLRRRLRRRPRCASCADVDDPRHRSSVLRTAPRLFGHGETCVVRPRARGQAGGPLRRTAGSSTSVAAAPTLTRRFDRLALL